MNAGQKVYTAHVDAESAFEAALLALKAFAESGYPLADRSGTVELTVRDVLGTKVSVERLGLARAGGKDAEGAGAEDEAKGEAGCPRVECPAMYEDDHYVETHELPTTQAGYYLIRYKLSGNMFRVTAENRDELAAKIQVGDWEPDPNNTKDEDDEEED